MRLKGHILPVAQLVVLPVCCTITYIWSVSLGHVEPGFPYISDTGTYPPESCLFGLLLAIYSFITAISVYMRWQQVRTFYETDATRCMHRVNNVALVLGLLAAFGVLLVANFQETNVIVVHLIGAGLAFGIGCLYTWFQTFLSYKAHLLPGHRPCMRHFRLVLSISITVSFSFVVIFAGTAGSKRENLTNLRWKPEDKGFPEHVVSTAFEWVAAFLSAAYFASFYEEFRHFHVTVPVEFHESYREDTNSYQVNGHTNENNAQYGSNSVTNFMTITTVSQ